MRHITDLIILSHTSAIKMAVWERYECHVWRESKSFTISFLPLEMNSIGNSGILSSPNSLTVLLK